MRSKQSYYNSEARSNAGLNASALKKIRTRSLCRHCLCSGLFLLALQVEQELGVLRSRVVNAALRFLLAFPAARALILIFGDRRCRVPVTDTLVPTVKELIVWDVVLLDVLLDLIEGPVGEGVNLDEARLVDFDDIKVTTLATLAAAATGEDCTDIELLIRSLGRFHLGNPVVQLLISLPELATMLLGEFLWRISAGGFIDMDIVHGVALADAVDKRDSFGEVVKCVQENNVNHLRPGDVQLGEHVKGHKAGETKGSGLKEIRESSDAPSQHI